MAINDRWLFKKLKSKYGKEKAFDLFADRIFPTVSRSILQRHFK